MSESKPLSYRMRWMGLTGQLMRGRQKMRLTQQEAADRLGVSLRTFSRWELGQAEPYAVQLFRWADLVGVVIASEEAKHVRIGILPSSIAQPEIPNVPLGTLQRQPERDEARSVEA